MIASFGGLLEFFLCNSHYIKLALYSHYFLIYRSFSLRDKVCSKFAMIGLSWVEYIWPSNIIMMILYIILPVQKVYTYYKLGAY